MKRLNSFVDLPIIAIEDLSTDSEVKKLCQILTMCVVCQYVVALSACGLIYSDIISAYLMNPIDVIFSAYFQVMRC